MEIMKKIRTFVFAIFLCSFLGTGNVEAQNAKARALGSMALYGTIGGALLGTATIAFGSGARSIAQGASLGLYAGLIFGSYVVLSHGFQKEYDDEYGSLPSRREKRLLGQWRPESSKSIYDYRKSVGKKKREWEFYIPILAMNY